MTTYIDDLTFKGLHGSWIYFSYFYQLKVNYEAIANFCECKNISFCVRVWGVRGKGVAFRGMRRWVGTACRVGYVVSVWYVHMYVICIF